MSELCSCLWQLGEVEVEKLFIFLTKQVTKKCLSGQDVDYNSYFYEKMKNVLCFSVFTLTKVNTLFTLIKVNSLSLFYGTNRGGEKSVYKSELVRITAQSKWQKWSTSRIAVSGTQTWFANANSERNTLTESDGRGPTQKSSWSTCTNSPARNSVWAFTTHSWKDRLLLCRREADAALRLECGEKIWCIIERAAIVI